MKKFLNSEIFFSELNEILSYSKLKTPPVKLTQAVNCRIRQSYVIGKRIVYYAPRTQNVSFLASASFGVELSEAAKIARARMIQCASVVVYTIFLPQGRKINFCVPYGSCEMLNELYCLTLSILRPLHRPQKVILRPKEKKKQIYDAFYLEISSNNSYSN